jgi:protein-disulfide isomerase
MHKFASALLIGFAALVLDGPVLAQGDSPDGFTPKQKAAIEQIIKDYLLANPEVLIDVQTALEAKMDKLQAERAKVTLKESADEIFRKGSSPVVGNPSGDVTIVEFFDYNCPYCKRALPDLSKLIDKDPKLRVVLKEFPILSKGSEQAARVALAARNQGKYWELHHALYAATGQVDEASALRVAEKLGLDIARLGKDMNVPEISMEIEGNRRLAAKLGIQGTPYFLVGDRTVPGAPENLLEVLTKQVQDVRKEGCPVC